MGQHHFRLPSSLSTRLVLGTVLLLITVVGLFTGSAILLIRSDQLASTYHAKSLEAELAGRDFVMLLDHVFESMRVSLAVAQTTNRSNVLRELQAVVDNQPDAVLMAVYRADLEHPEVAPARMGQAFDAKELAEVHGRIEDVIFPPELFRRALPLLRNRPYTLYNLGHPGGDPVLGLLLLDEQHGPGADGRIAIAQATVYLHRFTAQLRHKQVTIATTHGDILYDNNNAVDSEQLRGGADPLFTAALARRNDLPGVLDFQFQGRRFLGGYVSPGRGLVALTRVPRSEAMSAMFEMTLQFLGLGLLAILAGGAFAFYFARGLAAPLIRLREATRKVAGGDFRLQLEGSGIGEIGELTESFNVMSTKIAELFEENVEKVLLESEVDIASIVQQTLIPPPLYRQRELEIQSFYQPLSRCGGDWWGVVRVRNRICIAMGDATGHGLPSALITAAAHSCLNVLGKRSEEDPGFLITPNEILSYANQAIFDASQGDIMMTFFAAVIDTDKHLLSFANAGQNPPWFFKKLPQGGGYEFKSLVGSGVRLGEHRVAPRYEERTLELSRGDQLFLYTDGLIEASGSGGGMPFGKMRARKALEAHLGEGAEKALQTLVSEFHAFHEGKVLDDDVTVALLQMTS